MKSILKKVMAVVMVVALMSSGLAVPPKTVQAEISEGGKVISVSLGDDHSAAITENGDLYCWGCNNYGQVGNGTTKDQSTPVKVLENVASVSLGEGNSAAITNEGDLYCWGNNHYGQVGNGNGGDGEYQNTPVKVLGSVARMSLGEYHSAAITNEGILYCWGNNHYGQVGNGNSGDRKYQSTPVKVLGDVASVSLGEYHSAAITKDGILYCWGYKWSDQEGATHEQSTPMKVLESIANVSLGYGNSAAITKDGILYCWGNNKSGQVGNGTKEDQSTPVKVLESVAGVFLGSSFSAAITNGGDLYCWGHNGSGQVGNGTEENQSTPVKVLENVANVSLERSHSAAITKDGDLYCWGFNGNGEVGNNTTHEQSIPVKVLQSVTKVSLGDWHSAAITKSGDLYCWGCNYHGQVGNGTEIIGQTTPVRVLGNMSSSDFPEPISSSQPPSNTTGNKLQCTSSLTVDVGHEKTMFVITYEDTYEKLMALTKNVAWKSEDENVATIESIGFFSDPFPVKFSTENGSCETYRATGLQYIKGISEGTTTIIGTGSDGSKAACKVTVTRSQNSAGSGEGGGGSLSLGEEASGFGNDEVGKFFPKDWSLKHSTFPIEISKETEEDGSYKIKGSIGIGRTDLLDNETEWSKYKKNVEKAKGSSDHNRLRIFRDKYDVKSRCAVNIENFDRVPELSLMGYIENVYDKNGHLISADDGLALEGDWKGSVSWQFATPIGPLYLNLEGGAKAIATLGGTYDYSKRAFAFDTKNSSLKLTPSIALEGGYGIDKVATIGAKGEVSVPITILPPSKGELEAKASVHVQLVFVIDWTHDLASTGKIPLWDTTGKKKADNGNGLHLSEGKLSEMDTTFAKHTTKWNTGANQAKRKTAAKDIAGRDTDGILALQESILPSTLPLQAKIGGKNVMVFQAYDSSRTTLNSTVLKYSVQENGVWSEPKAVWDDGCADLYADLKVVDGKLVLAWQKGKKEIAGDVEKDGENVSKDIAQNSEIAFSVFDEKTNTFGKSMRITNNSQYDMMPRICNADKDIIVSWVRNDAADLMQENGANTICYAKWNGSSFGQETILAQSPGTIDDYVFYQNSEGVQTIFTGQANGISAIFDTNGHVPEALAENMMAAADGKIEGLAYADGKANFISKGTLYSYDVSKKTATSSLAGESAFGSQVRYCTNGTKSGYLWSVYDEETKMGSIKVSMAVEGGFSEPVTLWEQKNTMWRYLSPTLDEEGNWQIVANAFNTEKNSTSLVSLTKKAKSELALAGASVNEGDVVDGLTGMDYFITNTQDATIHNIIIAIALKGGKTITKKIPITILPGESKSGTAYIDLNGVNAAQDISISVYAEGQEGQSRSEVTDQVGLPDVSVKAASSEKAGKVTIEATLANESSVDANASLHLYADTKKSKELQKMEGISLKAKADSQVSFTVDKKEISYNKNGAAYLMLEAETPDGDFNGDNNTAYVILYQMGDNAQTTVKPSASPKPRDASKPYKKGYKITARNVAYKVTKVNHNGTGELSVTGMAKKKGKGFVSLKIGNTLKIKGKSFKITSIGKNAFKNCRTIKSVTLGKNIVRIGKQAFYGCKKLKRITIKTNKLKSKTVGGKAFKGIDPKSKIKVPKGKRKAYQKILNARGANRKAMTFI